jgi:hypothetical protein
MEKPLPPPIRVIRDTRSKPDEECFFFWKWLWGKLKSINV